MLTISERVLERTSGRWEGALRPPGAGLAREWRELDGRKLLVICKGDAFELYHGRHDPIVFSVSPRVVLSLALWLIWSWWISRTWCGLKTRIWSAALERVVNRGTQADKG